MSDKVCVYCLNGNPQYVKMVKHSILMLRQYSSLPIKVLFIDKPDDYFVSFCDENQVELLIKDWSGPEPDFFLTNKSYIEGIDSKSILFLDCDTFIFDNVEKIFDYYQDFDFVACENRWAYGQKYQLSFLKNDVHPFNSGVMLFNNFSQKKIFSEFFNVFALLRSRTTPLGVWLSESGNQWTAEEFSIAKCVTDLELKSTYFDRDYCYNIQWESDYAQMKNSIVFHSYTKQWETARRLLNKKLPMRFFKR